MNLDFNSKIIVLSICDQQMKRRSAPTALGLKGFHKTASVAILAIFSIFFFLNTIKAHAFSNLDSTSHSNSKSSFVAQGINKSSTVPITTLSGHKDSANQTTTVQRLTNDKQGIHRAPIILKANDLKAMAGYPVNSYRLFKSVGGKAEAIPFQIDEMTRYEDFVLPLGERPNPQEGDGIFEDIDELSFMGDDVGASQGISSWPSGSEPDLQFEITAENSEHESGAVYVGVWFSIPPPLAKKSYVQFDLKQSKIVTSRYIYNFDPNNYLVVKSIDLLKNGIPKRLVDSSSFYMKADLKYFITFLVNQSSIKSKLEAYKIGPIRNIVRVSFSFVLLKLNFEMGMYTEVSFFPNSVILPAIMYNPLDGSKSLNEGSGFYYGFALSENPRQLNLQTTLPEYKEKSHLDFLIGKKPVLTSYTVSASNSDWFMQMDIQPSSKMIQKGNAPSLYVENKTSNEMSDRPLDRAFPLGKSPINLAINFDLSNFSEGEHRVGFRLFFENESNPQILKSFANLSAWTYNVKRRLTQ